MPVIHTTFDWEVILDSLEDQKCVLFIGPQILTGPEGENIEQELASALDATAKDHPFIRQYYERDGFFLFREPRFRRRIVRQIRSFYEQSLSASEPFLEKIARIPFHLIFLLSPDNLLKRTFERLNYPYRHDYYFKNEPAKDFVAPTTESPLIYNMLGYIDEDESLLLTHNDLFDYLQSVFNGKSMSLGLRNELTSAHNYIFLGMPFERWYLQLLLRVLALHTDKLGGLERFASQPDNDFQKDIFEEQFNIEFVANECFSFIDELYEQCENRGLVKGEAASNSQEDSDIPEKVMNLISKAEHVKAMNQLKAHLEKQKPKSEELLKELILLMSDYRSLEKKFQLGMEEPGAKKEQNRIIYALLNLTDKAKKL